MGAIEDLTAQLHAAAKGQDAATRLAQLRGLRERISDLLGEADRLIGQQQRMREAEAQDGHRARLLTRENADLHDGTPGLEEAGVLSHDELDRLAEEGLEAEAVEQLAGEFAPELEP